MSLCENSLKVGLLASLCPIEMQRNISFPVWHVSFCHWSSIDLVGLGEALFGNQESVGPRAGTGEWSARRRQCIAGRGSRWCLEEPPHPGMDPPREGHCWSVGSTEKQLGPMGDRNPGSCIPRVPRPCVSPFPVLLTDPP